MKLIRNPNNWSCLLCSVAMVLDKEIKELIESVGHDGSEIVFSGLPEPAKRRGFHFQEFIPLILQSGFAVTPIEPLPTSTSDGKNEYLVNFSDPEERFRNLVVGHRGIFTGIGYRWHHAVAYDGKMIYDSNGIIYPYDDLKIKIDVFWLFTEIKSIEK